MNYTKMKRFAAIFSALMIVVGTTGMPINTHHCLMKGTDTWISLNPNHSCCDTEEGVELNCCSNDFELQKVDEELLSFNLTENLLPTFVIAFLQTFHLHDVPFVLTNNILPQNSDPPPVPDDIHVLLQVFLL